MIEGNIIEPVVRVYIFNKKGELFLIKNPKEQNLFTTPGGHIDFGENIVDAVKREAKEETGLDIVNIEFLSVGEYYDKKREKHFINIRHKAEVADDDQEPKLQPDEAIDYLWTSLEDALDNPEVKMTVKNHIKEYFLNTTINKEEEYKIGWQRALADYKNLQNEINNRRGEWVKMSELQILEDFIPVYENFKKAFEHREQMKEENGWKQWSEGIRHIMRQFGDILKSHNIEEIKTVGEKFDPRFHEAMGEEESEKYVPGMILKEISGGYKMGNRVVRPAKVIIAK